MTHETVIRWHGRAERGTNTAVKLFSRGIVREGRYVQSYPASHCSHLGEPAIHYTRIADVPFVEHCPAVGPSVVAVLDEDLLVSSDVASRLAPGGLVLVNSPAGPDVLQRNLGLEAYEVSTLDATAIALEYLAADLPNAALLGALSRLTGLVKLRTLAEQIDLEFGRHVSEGVARANVLALRRGSDDVRSVGALATA